MFGVMLKDIKNVRGQLLYYAAVVAVFFAIGIILKNVYFYMGAIIFVAAVLPISALAYDEKDNWDKFALASGVTRGQLVIARYVLGIVAFVPFFGVGFLFFVMPALRNTETLSSLFVFGGIGLLAMSAALPTAFRLGVEKARAAYTVILACALAFGIGISLLFARLGIASGLTAASVIFALGIAGLLISVRISEAIYRAKDF